MTAVLRTPILRKIIKKKFGDLVNTVKKSATGSLEEEAAQIGVSRQALSQYADGSVPQADVLLTTFLKWKWSIQLKDSGGTPDWYEFGLSDVEGGIERRKAESTQLSLFDALENLDQDITTLRKSVGRAENEIRRAFGKARRKA